MTEKNNHEEKAPKKNPRDMGISPEEEALTPPRSDFLSVVMVSLGALIAGVIGGLLIFFLSYLLNGTSFTGGANAVLFSMITFFCLVIGNLVLYFITSLVFPGRYTRTRTSLGQIVVFIIFLFIFFMPFYLIMGKSETAENTILVPYTLHILTSSLGVGIITSIVVNYRYSLLGIYGNFIGFLFSSLISLYVFQYFTKSMNALYGLIGLMMVSFFFTTFFRALFEFLYYRLYLLNGSDMLGNVFSRIEKEEKEKEQEAEKELTKFK